jgi:hypothetical protein
MDSTGNVLPLPGEYAQKGEWALGVVDQAMASARLDQKYIARPHRKLFAVEDPRPPALQNEVKVFRIGMGMLTDGCARLQGGAAQAHHTIHLAVLEVVPAPSNPDAPPDVLLRFLQQIAKLSDHGVISLK